MRTSPGQSTPSSVSGEQKDPLTCKPGTQLNSKPSFTRTACAQKLGFANADLLQSTDWTRVTTDMRQAQPRTPRWIWAHDPEPHLYEYWEANAWDVAEGVRFDESVRVRPNFPPGYRFVEWGIEGIMEGKKMGREVELGEGDWS